MKLYALVRSLEDAGPRLTYRLLQDAARENGMELVPLEQEKILFDSEVSHLTEDHSAFYRMATGPAQILAEQLLIKPTMSTVYADWRMPPLGSSWADTVLMFRKKLPVIPTVFLFAYHDKSRIEATVERLGGYPVVAKYTGLSHGKGVFLCNNYEELSLLISKYSSNKYHQLALRKFISGAIHLRSVVIGNKVADVIRYNQPEDDFRTNAVATPTATAYEATDELNRLAVSAARAYGVKLAGVDILLDADGNAWLAEVNTPCNYGRNYLTNGKNLANDLIKMLKANIDN